jgi:hypothetical protein
MFSWSFVHHVVKSWNPYDLWSWPCVTLCTENMHSFGTLQVKKDSNQPFLLSGCKVEDGQGTMLVRCLSTSNSFATVCEPNLFQQNIYHSPSHLVFGTGYWRWHTHWMGPSHGSNQSWQWRRDTSPSKLQFCDWTALSDLVSICVFLPQLLASTLVE